MITGVSQNTICLFRHGETEWNVQGRRQGHLDSPLTQRGRLQAKRNAQGLQRQRSLRGEIAVFASPLGRAQVTASIMVNELRLSESAIVLEPRLKECSFGSWEGMTTPEIKALYPEAWRLRSSDRWKVAAPSGESYADVHERVTDWYANAELAETTIVVCHGLTSRVFLGLYAGLSQEEVFHLREPQDGYYELCDGAAVFVE